MLKHLIHQPFVFATGLAALVHSTWSLGTLFAGSEPEQFTFAWLAWVLPAALIAFALDVGQIVTSSEIRAGSRSRRKYLTFAVFAIATYYLQWVYMVHHMPDLQLSAGIRETWGDIVTLIRDCAIWIIPALLPLSTLLYTLSSDEMQITEPAQPDILPEVQTEHAEILQIDDVEEAPALQAPMAYIVTCEACGWSSSYDNEESSLRGIRAHKSRYCTANPVTQNGHTHNEYETS